ncbi:MAG: 3-hydroxyacyl-ACP dehydratase FabZ [Myxococcales bacterium]|nr:3-hydroxyacyl-ACP dehydratase FabZ [Myxococcales bacterium]
MTILDLQQIKAYLPHRYPFLLVDRVDALELGKCLHARKAITGNEAFFQGHFPGNPIFPGVLQLEAMGQAGVLLAILSGAPVSESVSIYAGGIDKCRFRRPVVPGDQLILRAELVKRRMGVFRLDCCAEVDGEVASSAHITVTTGPAPKRSTISEELPAPIFSA